MRKNLLLVALSGAFAIALVEASLRVTGYGAASETIEPFDLYYFRDRPAALRDQRTAFAYEPDSSVRQLVVVVTKQGRAIEYDTTLTTNNLGLVQKRNLSPGETAVVVIGDSFTEGVGAPPWFYDVEAEIGGEFRLANLGVVNTGAQHWDARFRGSRRTIMWPASSWRSLRTICGDRHPGGRGSMDPS